MIALTKKGITFRWSNQCEQAFVQLKQAFTNAPILKHFDYEAACVVETDASDFVSAGVLSQYDEDGTLRPVAYFSKRHLPAECNYEIYDKELLAIVRAFEMWRPELEGSPLPVRVLSDHKNLQYFTTTKQLSHRQARWAEYLSRFNFKIVYRPGKQGGKPDALTRRSQDLPADVDDERIAQRKQVLLPPNMFEDSPSTMYDEALVRLSPLELSDRSTQQIIDDEYDKDAFIKEVLELVRAGARRSKKITLSECEERDGRLYYQDRLVVPDHDELKLKILQHVHDSPVGGHLGRFKTLDLIRREYYWPGIRESVKRYCNSCHTCSRAKVSRETYHGVLKPLPIPVRKWLDVSMDFITDLPESSGCTAILVVVDRLSKMRHFIPCKDMDAPTVARLFVQHVFKLHGLPESIVSDRGTQFVSEFWRCLCQILKIDAKYSTAYHPETDGQTENANAFLEQYLRMFVNYLQDDWYDWLPLAEFTANNTTSETTRVSPFFANYGQNPRMGFEPVQERPRSTPYVHVQRDAATAFGERMQRIDEFLRETMAYAQEQHADQANRRRTPAPAYQVGDWVWLNGAKIKTERPTKKLDHRWLGPFKITKVVSSHSYRLELYASMKIHNVFHVNVLRAVNDEPLPGQRQDPPPPVAVNEDDDEPDEYFIEAIVDSRRRNRAVQYRVKWRGYEEKTWEPWENVKDSEALDVFHQRYPNKPQHDEYVYEP
jgi:hypothetical protein